MLRSHKTFLFDADGTLWNSKGLIDGADRFLKYLKKTGRSVFLVTNNSTKSIEQYLQKCKRLGLDIEHSEIIGSANVAAYTLFKNGIRGPLYVIGQEGIGHELDKFEIEHFGIGVCGVLVGFDCHFNYIKLMKATTYIGKGVPFYATNEDALLPYEDYFMPGTGSLVASVRKASGVEPIVFGKPCKPIWDFIKEKYGAEPETTMMVGDRLVLDSKAHGLHTACVMTGVTSAELLKEVRNDPAKEAILCPDQVFPSVKEMCEQLMKEDEQAVGTS